MIRSLMASTALLALLTTGALAQQQPADQTQPPQAQQPAGDQQQAQPATPPEGVKQTQEQGEILVDDLVGQTVYSGQAEDAEELGDISDLVLDESGSVSAVVIGVGGFLGIGEKSVAIDFEQLEFTQDQNGEMRIVVNATEEQMEAAPEFEETDQTRLYGGLAEGERSSVRLPERQEQAQDQQTAQQPDQPAQDQQTAQRPGQPAQDQQMAQQPDQQAAQQPDRPAQDQQMAQQPDQPAGQQPDQQMAQQPDQQPQDQPAAGGQAAAVAFVEAAESGESRASQWIGKQIVTAEDEEIGEVQDLLVDEQGMTESVIVDVSGFVESEKQVAIPFEDIQVEQQEGQEDVRLVANLSQEELQQAPAFESQESAAAQDPQAPQPDQQAAQQPDQQAQPQDQQTAAGEQQPSASGQAQERQAARAPGVEQTMSGISADQLMGANVIGANDEEIGQVGDVIFGQDGQIRAVIVDVGGFLGIGAKEVAIQFDQAHVQRQEGEELALMIPATEEQLEQAPEYQDMAELQQQGQQPAGQQPGAEQPPQAQPDQPPAGQPAQQ